MAPSNHQVSQGSVIGPRPESQRRGGRQAWHWIALLILLLAAPAQAYVLGPTTPGDWGSGGGPVTITYSFMATGVAYDETPSGGSGTISALSDFMPGGWKAQIEAALNAWSSISANLTFTEVADLGEDFNAAQLSGDIRFGGHAFDGANGTLAHGYYPPNNGVSAAGDIHFDTAETWKIGFGGGGFDIFQVAAHEIGHALGFAHTAVPNSLMNPSYTEAFSGPQADEVAAVQWVYEAMGSGPSAGGAPEPTTGALGFIVLGTIGIRVRLRRAA